MSNSEPVQKLKPAVDRKALREKDKDHLEDVIGNIPPMPVPENLERKKEIINGKLHTWCEYVPPSYFKSGQSVPLLVSLHGGGSTGEAAAKATTFTTIADRENFIIVYPEATLSYEDEEGRHHEWNAFYMNNPKEDESVWLKLFIEKICHEYRIDRSRIYLTGHSNGDQMALHLAVTYPELFAACAGLNGPTHPDKILDIDGNKMKPGNPLPYLRWNGERDPRGGGVATRPEVNRLLNQYWIENNSCTSSPLFSLDGKMNTIVYESDFGAEVRFVEYKGGPHKLNIELASVVWYEFFCRFSRGSDGTITELSNSKQHVPEIFTAALAEGMSNALVNGQKIKLDSTNPNAKAFILENSLLVPINFITEIFDVQIEWSPNSRQATLTYQDRKCVITDDHPALWIDHKVVPFAVNPRMIEGNLWVPVSELAEQLFDKKVSMTDGVLYISNRYTEISKSIAYEVKKFLV